MRRLNKDQKDFAEANHTVVFRYLRNMRLDETDSYDVIIFGYIKAVFDYTEKVYLQRYRFSTLAYKAMSIKLIDHYRYKDRKKRNAPMFSLDSFLLNENQKPNSYDYQIEWLNDALFWLDVKSMLTERQYAFLLSKVNGDSNIEIAEKYGVTKNHLRTIFQKIRKTLRNILLFILKNWQ